LAHGLLLTYPTLHFKKLEYLPLKLDPNSGLRKHGYGTSIIIEYDYIPNLKSVKISDGLTENLADIQISQLENSKIQLDISFWLTLG